MLPMLKRMNAATIVLLIAAVVGWIGAIGRSLAPPGVASKISVIGVGWTGAGTASLTAALQTLGYKSYEMQQAIYNGDQAIWNDALKADGELATLHATEAAIRHLEETGHSASTGFPGCLLYKQLLERNPEAKVRKTQA